MVFCVGVFAMPAVNLFFDVAQPDGGTFRGRNVGNEIYNYKITSDGYAVVRDPLGYYSYANADGESSGIYVHDVSARTESESAFLQTLDAAAVRALLESRRDDRSYQNFVIDTTNLYAELSVEMIPSPRYMPTVNANLNSGVKKALVVLVQFQDVKFTIEDASAYFTQYVNGVGFKEYNNQGSVAAYFDANSKGKFVPDFDVVGPVTISGRAYRDYGANSKYGNAGARVALAEALDSLVVRGDVDFNVYDNDGDHYLDFVHMIYAGYGANDGGADSAIWPHMWYMSGLNGQRHKVAYRTYVDKYSCSQELDGLYHIRNPKSYAPVGVGTFIHEFSHLLGVGDHYSNDVEYTLGKWDVMDAGAYNCAANPNGPISCSPPYYSAFERISLGWMTPTDLVKGDSVVLGLLKDNEAYRVRNPKNRDEFFLLEYRDGLEWDGSLPNHGMLIWHIDYDATVWSTAKINTSTRLHVDIEEADGVASGQTMTTDVFPGTTRLGRVRQFKKFITWDGTDLDISLTNIYEGTNRDYVWFTVNGDVVYFDEDDEEEPEVASSSSGTFGCSGVDCDESDFEVAQGSASEDVGDSGTDAGGVTDGGTGVEVTTGEPNIGGGITEEIFDEGNVGDLSETVDEPDEDFEVSENGYGSVQSRWDDILADGSTESLKDGGRAGWSSGRLDLDALPPGRYLVRIFSLNGNVLYTGEVEGRFDRSLLRKYGKMSLILQISSGNKPIFSGRIQ